MNEPKGIYFADDEEQKICPCCVKRMLADREATIQEISESQMLIAEPWMSCDECGLPIARAECEAAFEKVMCELAAFMGLEAPPEENDPRVKANEALRKAQAEYAEVYRKIVQVRNSMVAAGQPISSEPVLPE